MKNNIFIVILFYAFTCISISSLKGMDQNLLQIKSLKEEKKELLNDMRLCSGINIGISVFGISAGTSGIIGALFKDRVLELTGIIGSTVSAALLITSNCMLCCQNPADNDNEYGDL